jgi:hypothetical protein
MKMLGILISAVATLSISIGSTGPAAAQVNMQYSGQANGQYSGQYGGQYSGQFSGQYYGRGSSDQTHRQTPGTGAMASPVFRSIPVNVENYHIRHRAPITFITTARGVAATSKIAARDRTANALT